MCKKSFPNRFPFRAQDSFSFQPWNNFYFCNSGSAPGRSGRSRRCWGLTAVAPAPLLMSLWWWQISGTWTSTCTTWRTPANVSRMLTGKSWPLAVFLWLWVREFHGGGEMHANVSCHLKEKHTVPGDSCLPSSVHHHSEQEGAQSWSLKQRHQHLQLDLPVRPTAHLTYSSDVPHRSSIRFCHFRLTRAAPWFLSRQPVMCCSRMLESSYWKRRGCWTSNVKKRHRFVCFAGGDHTIAYPILQAVAEK